MLGSGVRLEELTCGVHLAPHAIALDAGSTDSGPAYLATGHSKYTADSVKRDLALLLSARDRAGVPLLIGSCGTSGCDRALDDTLALVLEVAGTLKLRPRIAVLYSEQDKRVLKAKAAAGKVMALAPAKRVDDATLDACVHVVALMGPEPYIAAVEAGADIVLGGRTTDTAILAAVPLMRGAAAGAAWHAAKTAECGGLCTINPTSPGVMMTVDDEGFDIVPLAPENRCTPETVSAHMLYENSDPFRLTEPGGVLDVSEARYLAQDARCVRVTGSRYETMPYTMKLEGAGGGAYQTIMIVGIRDPEVLKDIDGFLERMAGELHGRVQRTLNLAPDAYDISLRPYGWNAVSGRRPPETASPPLEIGLLFVATARDQGVATRIARVCNPVFFHYPVRLTKELPSYAFPFSPAEIERGQVFEFLLNHVVEVTSPDELVRTRWVEVPPLLEGEDA